jgi:hypothetical protein
MKHISIVAALLISTNAWAEVPSVGSRPLVQVKSKSQFTCRLVGNVKGLKLWAGDCVPPEISTTSENAEPLAREITHSLPEDKEK